MVEREVFEHERFIPLKGWGAKGHFLPGDRKRYTLAPNASDGAMEFPNVHLPEGKHAAVLKSTLCD